MASKRKSRYMAPKAAAAMRNSTENFFSRMSSFSPRIPM